MVSRALSSNAAVAARCSSDLQCLSELKAGTQIEAGRSIRASRWRFVSTGDCTRSAQYGQRRFRSGFEASQRQQQRATRVLHLGGTEWPRFVSRRALKCRCWRIAVKAADRNEFEDGAGFDADEVQRRASEMAANVKRKAAEAMDDLKRKAVELDREQDLTGKAKTATQSAKEKLEELGDDLRRKFDKADRKYKVSDAAKKVVDSAKVSFDDADQEYGLRRRFRNLMVDFQRTWPIYARRLDDFAATPFGRAASFLFVCWLLFSGWILTFINIAAVLFLWVIPIAIPLLLRYVDKTSVIQGTCPACARPFAGPRNQVLVCQSCQGVVWQPREDYSSRNDPASRIIDVEADSD